MRAVWTAALLVACAPQRSREVTVRPIQRPATIQRPAAPARNADGVVVLPDNEWTGSGINIDTQIPPASSIVTDDKEAAAAAKVMETERVRMEKQISDDDNAEELPPSSTVAEPEPDQLGAEDPPPTKEQREADRKFRKLQSTPKGRRIVHAMILNRVIQEKYDETMEVFASGKSADVLVFESPHCGEGKGGLYKLMENIETRRELKSFGYKLIVCQGGRFSEAWLPSGAVVK